MRRARVLIARQLKQKWSRYAPSRFQMEEVSQMSGLVEAMVNRMPAVLLIPIDFPGLGGPPGLRDVRRLSPATKIVVLSPAVSADEELEVLRGGAKGYSGPVGTDVLFKMIDKVQEGEVWAGRKTIGALLEELYTAVDVSSREYSLLQSELQRLTSRERQILRLLAQGESNKEIASALNISVSTIKAHLTKIFRKLGQPDRVRLALYASAIGTLEAPVKPQEQ
jgi:RNA polymerase sigma factor (sigma-70 family)